MLVLNVGEIKISIISIYTFFFYLESYLIAFILGGRLLLSHTYRWGTWASSVLGSIYNYWFKFRPSSFDDFLSDLFFSCHSQISLLRGAFLDYSIQKALSSLFHWYFIFIVLIIIPLSFFSLINLFIFSIYYREEDFVFFLVPHPSTVIVPDIQLILKKYLMDEYIFLHYTISLY